MAELDAYWRNIEAVGPEDELPYFLRDFKFHVWNVRDAGNRPHGELLANAEARAGVEFDVRPAKFPGIRAGLGINISGLRPMTEHWPQIIADVAYMQRAYVKLVGTNQLTLFHVWQLSKIMSGLPSFVYLRGKEKAVPVRVSAMFRGIIGIDSMTQALMAEGSSPMAPLTTEVIVDAAEKGGFLSTGGRACAGPLHMVQEFTNAVIHGTDKEGAPSAVEELCGDVDQFMRYGEIGSHWDLANHLYRASTRVLADRALAALREIETVARERKLARAIAWQQIQRSALLHMDLAFFSLLDSALRPEQIAPAIPLIEMFVGMLVGPAASAAAPSALSALTPIVSEALPWAPEGAVKTLATVWSDYLALEHRMAALCLYLQENAKTHLTSLHDRARSPMWHSSGPRWLTSSDFTDRIGATLGDVMAAAFNVEVKTRRDGAPEITPASRALG